MLRAAPRLRFRSWKMQMPGPHPGHCASWRSSGAGDWRISEFTPRRLRRLERGVLLARFGHEGKSLRQAAQKLGTEAHVEACGRGAAQDAFRGLEHGQRIFKMSEVRQDDAALKRNCVFARMNRIEIRPDLRHGGTKVVGVGTSAPDLTRQHRK